MFIKSILHFCASFIFTCSFLCLATFFASITFFICILYNNFLPFLVLQQSFSQVHFSSSTVSCSSSLTLVSFSYLINLILHTSVTLCSINFHFVPSSFHILFSLNLLSIHSVERVVLGFLVIPFILPHSQILNFSLKHLALSLPDAILLETLECCDSQSEYTAAFLMA